MKPTFSFGIPRTASIHVFVTLWFLLVHLNPNGDFISERIMFQTLAMKDNTFENNPPLYPGVDVGFFPDHIRECL